MEDSSCILEYAMCMFFSCEGAKSFFQFDVTLLVWSTSSCTLEHAMSMFQGAKGSFQF